MATTGALNDIRRLGEASRKTEAADLADSLAERADAEALLTLATWAFTGSPLARDLGRARRWFASAAERGSEEAAECFIALLAQGVGGMRDWAGAMRELAARTDGASRRQLDLLAEMDLLADGVPRSVPRGQPLATAPRLLLVRGLLSAAECAYLIDKAGPLLRPSVVVHPVTGDLVRDDVRTSETAALPILLEDPVVHAINRRLAAACGTDVRQGEPLQILRYRPGQQYRPHQDAIAGAANQRILTALVYLNAGYQGGETLFPVPNIAVRGGIGDALFFSNVTDRGGTDPAAVHAGLPVTSGSKMLASRWIRARPLL